MPIPALAVAGGSLLFKGLSSLFGGKAKKKQYNVQRNAAIAGLNIKQKQGEDARRARLQLANSILSRVPSTTAGGGVNTNVALDPELVKQLGVEHTYDFGSAVPEYAGGGVNGFLEGLFGGAADTLPYLGGGGNADAAAGGPIQGVDISPTAGAASAPSASPTVSWDELFRQSGGGGSGPY